MPVGQMESSVCVIAADLPTSLPEESNVSLFGGIHYATYVPGELLRKAVALTEPFTPRESDNVSEVSTADTQSADIPVSHETTEDVLGINLLPSLGSLNHASGTCSPCGFFYKGGCSQGTECKFCHLCEEGSIELKRKMKRKIVKATFRQKVGDGM
jgi:hypothetical protein